MPTAKTFDHRVNTVSEIKAVGPDITERDNSSLALAVSRVYPAFAEIFDREGIDETELLRVVYRMAGEIQPTVDVPKMKRRPLKPVTTSQQPTGKPVSPESGGGGQPKDPGEPDPSAQADNSTG